MDENVSQDRGNGPGKKVNRLVALGLIKEKGKKEEGLQKTDGFNRELAQNQNESAVEEKNFATRKRQLELGRKIESMYNQVFLGEKGSGDSADFWEDEGELAKEVKAPGRPKVKEYNFKKLTVTLPLKYAEFLSRVEIAETTVSIKGSKKRAVFKRANEGLGSRMRKIIDHYLVYSRREREQVKVLVQILGEMEKDLKLYIAKYKRSEFYHDVEEIEARLKKKLHQFELVCDILKFSVDDLKSLLTAVQFKNYDFVLAIVSNQQNDSVENILIDGDQ